MDETPWLSKEPLKKIEGIPDYGWRVRLDYRSKEPCVPFTIPRLHQLPGLLGLSYRYFMTWNKKRKEGKKLFIDNLDLCIWRPIYGVPIGGIGCGTIGRGYQGEFCRFQMIPGMYKYNTVLANQFMVTIRKKGQTVYQQVLSPHRPDTLALSSWNWAYPKDKAWYHGLYPRSWTVYELPGQNVRLICRQVSPVFPHDYKDTSLPAAVFVWSIENKNAEPIDVSITFTYKNGQGEKEDRAGGVWNEPFLATEGAHKVQGVMIHQSFRDTACTHAVAARRKPGVDVSHQVAFDPCGDGRALWMDLINDGALGQTMEASKATVCGQEVAAAVCAKCHIEAGHTQEVEFSLTWDMPLIQFGSKQQMYKRRYARWFGHKGDASPKLASYSLNTYETWEQKIDEWQQPILDNRNLPSWYKSALFNELYFVSDGGTLWVDPVGELNGFKHKHDDQLASLVKEYSKFAYLEGQEYRMYNTYDVHHYASFALICLWPKLQLSLQYEIGAAVASEQLTEVRYCMSGEWLPSKVKSCVPHDIGDPDDDPWLRINAYLIHPTQEWKDLNPKFILQVYRDYIAAKDEQFLQDMYPYTKAVMENSLRWDVDNDGIIDNAGFADQTYDAWTMKGASAYCGGMWVAAVKCFVEMANKLGHGDDHQKWTEILNKAKESFENKLWNGAYYNFDSSTSGHHDSIISDQLAGHWFLKASHIPDDSVFPREHVLSALDVIFKHNVLPFDGGKMGAINGMRPDGKKDITSPQSEEFWCGVSYSLGALMFQEGLMDMGWQTAYGVYHVCYERYGLHFQTPEAYFDDHRYRSLGYMRPLCIWAMQYALEHFQPQLLKD